MSTIRDSAFVAGTRAVWLAASLRRRTPRSRSGGCVSRSRRDRRRLVQPRDEDIIVMARNGVATAKVRRRKSLPATCSNACSAQASASNSRSWSKAETSIGPSVGDASVSAFARWKCPSAMGDWRAPSFLDGGPEFQGKMPDGACRAQRPAASVHPLFAAMDPEADSDVRA